MCVFVLVLVFVFVTVCVECEWKGEEGGRCVVFVVRYSNLTADSLRSVPQDKNGAQQLHQVKRMIGGFGNVLFSIYSQTLNG